MKIIFPSILGAILLLVLFGNIIEKIEINSIPPQILSKVDSLYILHSVPQFIKKRYGSAFNILEPEAKRAQCSINRIFYSPNRLKMITWLILRVPKDEDTSNQVYLYSGGVLIGFRSDNYSPWNLYEFDEIIPVDFTKPSQIQNQYEQYFFKAMKNDAVYIVTIDTSFGGNVLGERNTEGMILKSYGYNLQDKDFWEKSLIWQKGARIPEYYNFQTNGNVTPSDNDPLAHIPHLSYPDSILLMYQNGLGK